jgi:fructokinase
MADGRATPLVAAFELGGSKVLCALGTSERVVSEARFATADPERTLSAIEAFLAPYRGSFAAIGIASFGPLELDPSSPDFGSLLATPKPGWSFAPLASRLQRTFGVPVAIDTDVNAAALAEQLLGAGEGADPCLYVTVGTGIGVGVVSGGSPLHGLLHAELGHLPAAPLCDYEGCCPFHGRCLEGVASAPAIAQRTGAAPEKLADEHPVWELIGRYLGQLLVACVLAHAPRRIVLGGGVLARAGLRERARRHLVELLAGYIPRRELTHEGVEDYVRAPFFEQRAGLMGALLLAEAAVSPT